MNWPAHRTIKDFGESHVYLVILSFLLLAGVIRDCWLLLLLPLVLSNSKSKSFFYWFNRLDKVVFIRLLVMLNKAEEVPYHNLGKYLQTFVLLVGYHLRTLVCPPPGIQLNDSLSEKIKKYRGCHTFIFLFNSIWHEYEPNIRNVSTQVNSLERSFQTPSDYQRHTLHMIDWINVVFFIIVYIKIQKLIGNNAFLR